jgi:hypothetical protein
VINEAALSIPARGQGDPERNALRGSGATQWDITLRRQFRFPELSYLQSLLSGCVSGNSCNLLHSSMMRPLAPGTI